ncbi:GIP [Symbiodinium sp. CCMP2592]|nr:GIP [Symbiodinium sp. CCMP2592]
MEAGKAADAFGLLPGHEIQVADGESAYTQAKLGGPATWVRLPRDRWLPEWHGKYHDPVVRLVLALYGHPDAGGFWEQHCEKALRSVGFEQCPDWKSVFRHPKLNLMLVVYVDDFKLSGPKANLANGWELMASKIKLEPPSSIKRYLGCEHEPKKAFPELTFGDRDTTVAQGSVGPREIRMIKYDMRSFMEQCVSRYVELCGPKYKATLRSADTPFLDESRPEFDTNPDRPEVNRLLGHPTDTPVPPGKGVLGDCAAAVLMKILYGARMGRYDLIRPVQALASLITKWDGLCDKKEQAATEEGCCQDTGCPITSAEVSLALRGGPSERTWMKAMMLKIGVQEIPQASIWQRLEQLACNSGFDQRLHQLVDSFLLSNHPLADKQRKQYPREFMDFIDRYRVMCALAFSRVATLSGDAAGVREKMDLTMALARHCMHFQAQTFKGSRETLSNDTLRLMGTCYIPSPLASWNRNLMGFSSSSAEQRWLRTDTSIKHNDLTKLSPIELSRDAVNPAEAAKFFKGFLQLRPTLSFIPGAFLAIKALNRFPTLDSLKEQATHLENDRKEHGYDLPAVDANGIGEVAAFRNEDDDENNPLMRGWVSFMKAMAEAYPGRCVSIDDTLNWGASTQMTYEDGASQITVRPTDGWVYVPAMNSDIYDPQETLLHGTNLRYLWSILAHGGLFGEDYVTDDHGSHEPCVWVTGHAPEAAGSYASGTYLGGGYWFQVMICVSRTMVNSHSRTTKKLGGSQKQIRIGTRFLELCGIAFRPFRLLDDREQGVSTSPNYVVHGHRFLSADGMKAVAWHPWMEASPIDPRILKLLGDSVARDNVEFADLTIQGGNTTQQAASTEPEQPVATAADDQAGAGGSEATERITVNPVVLRRNHWMPDTYGTSEQATVGGRYALLSELQSSSYRIELAPFFQRRAPILGEEGSQGLPKPTKLETIAGGPSKEWEAWCRHYRKAYGALLGNFGYTPAKNIKGIVYDEENTTDIIGAPVWSPADALVAVSIHGIRTVTTMASTIAFGGAPPTIKPAVPSKPQRFVVMHDGLLTFRSAKSWHDGEMNTHLKNALASFGFPESEVRVQAFDESEKLKEMVDTLELMRSDPSVPPSNVHILILWKGDELWKMDQGWNKLTGDIDTARSQYAKLTARDALEKYNTIYGSVSLCGPVSPSMGYLPTLPGPLFEKYREEMRSIWDEVRRSNFLSLSFDAILEGLPYLKGYHIMHESKTIGVLCTRICSMFTLAALARFPSYATRREYEIAHDKMWARTPVPEERSTGTVKAIVHSTVQDLIEGADRGADHRAGKTVDMSQLGFDDDDDEEMADDAGPTAPENPIKQEQATLADLPGVRHPDPIELPTTPVPGQAMPVSPGLAPAATNDEESSNSSDDAGQQGDGDAAMPEVKKEESDEEFNELLEGMTEAFGKLPTPRDAERTVAANRDAARPPAVPTIPLSTMKKPKPFGGVEAAGPTAESRQGYAHFESQVSEIEARREQAAKMKAHIAEVAKGATGVENAEHLRSIADGLAKIMDPNMSDDNVFQGAMYPPGDYALDAVTNRLAQGRRRVESNSNLIREMASDRFTPVLINRDTGETVSAIDARWTPEYGNRGELEAKVGAIISNLDAVDLEVPTPHDWPDLIAPTPGKVIQSMRVALVNNTAARLTREDLKLPPGFAMQRRVTEFRKPEEDPVQSLMGLTDDLSYGTTGRSGDDRLSQFQRSVAVQLRRNTAGFIASEFQKHARSIAASSSRRSDASGALSSQGEGAADNDLPSTEQVSVASERATTPPPPNVAPPPPPTAAAPPRASEEIAKEDDDDTKMDDDTADQKPEQKPEEDVQDEVPGKAPPPAARTAENPPEHGVRSSSPNDMVAQGAVLSGARGPDIDIDPASTTADQAANDPRNFRIEGPGIKATTIHRPDQMPERGIDSIAPIVQYEMTSVPIALTDFVTPGLDMGIDDSVHGRLVSATCLPPTDEQRKYSRRRFAMLSSNQTVYLNVALHKKPVKGDHDTFLRPESYEDCREINDAVRAYNAKEAKFRSVGGTSVSCSRLLIDDAQNIPAARIPDAGMINLVRKLMFRVLTQTKEYPSATAERAQNRPQDQERGIPLYSRFDQSGIIAFDVIPMYMEREREYMKANAGENDGRILLQTNILDEHGEPTEITTQCIMEIARTDNNRMFEFFYSTIDNDGSPQFVGIRATYGFGPDNFNRFRLLTKCQHGPFIQLAQDHYVGGERKRNVARYHPQYGWGCATIREFFGYMSDCKINPPKGRLFLTLLPYAPGSGHNNEWEEVYMNVRMNPGRETLSNTASSQSMLPEGMGSNRMIVFAIDLHMIAAGINPIVFHPRGYYAIKDSIPLACMPIAYFMDTGSLVFNTVEYYGSHAEWLNELIERNELKEFRLHEYPAIKQLRNFPVSRSLAEDHRQTAFFGVPPIKCTAADTSPKEVELFKKSVRGTIQGAIRLDISIERLVAGITGKEARCGVEEFLNSQSIACAITIVKHFGAVFATCREKPLCYYARWSIHCQRAYRVCLSRGYLSPFYTGGTIDYTVDSDMVEKIRLAHLPLQNANLAMRRQIRLSTEFGTLDEFRATITDTQKYQRYMRVGSESLSALLAKVTLTTCYGIPMKGEPGYISDDEAEEIEGTAAATEKPKGKGKGEEEPDVQAINWRDLDPLGRNFIPNHTDPRFTIIADGNTALLDAPETPDEKRKEFKEFVRDHSIKIKEWFDDDRATEKTFFNLVEGVKDQLPDTKRTDPVLMKKNEDVFEALPDELEEPQELFDVAARQARRRDDTLQRRVQATEQRHASIPEAHAVPVPPDDEDEDDAELERAIRPGPKSQRTGREHLGGVAPETSPPPPRERPPPSNPPSRKMSRQSGYNVPHADGETLMVSGRAPYSDQMGLPLVLRMKTRVPEPDLDNPTIEDIIRMYHAPNTLPVVRKKVANVIISMNANPDVMSAQPTVPSPPTLEGEENGPRYENAQEERQRMAARQNPQTGPAAEAPMMVNGVDPRRVDVAREAPLQAEPRVAGPPPEGPHQAPEQPGPLMIPVLGQGQVDGGTVISPSSSAGYESIPTRPASPQRPQSGQPEAERTMAMEYSVQQQAGGPPVVRWVARLTEFLRSSTRGNGLQGLCPYRLLYLFGNLRKVLAIYALVSIGMGLKHMIGLQRFKYVIGLQMFKYVIGLQMVVYVIGLQRVVYVIGLQRVKYVIVPQRVGYVIGLQRVKYVIVPQRVVYVIGLQRVKYVIVPQRVKYVIVPQRVKGEIGLLVVVYVIGPLRVPKGIIRNLLNTRATRLSTLTCERDAERAEPTPTSGPSTLELLGFIATGMKQLQDVQLKQMEKKSDVPEVVKPGVSSLPLLNAPGQDTSPVDIQDWLEEVGGVMTDLSDSSWEWWTQAKELAEAHYRKWVKSTPLEKISLAMPRSPSLEQGRYGRVNARAAGMVLAALPQEVKTEMIIKKVSGSTASLIFKLLTVYRPGGEREKTLLLQQLTAPEVAATAEEAVQGLRRWGRWYARAKDLTVAVPDPVLMIKGLAAIVSVVLGRHQDVWLRTSMVRQKLQLDSNPLEETSLDYHKHLQAASPTKDRTCKWFAKSEGGCRRGADCQFVHEWGTTYSQGRKMVAPEEERPKELQQMLVDASKMLKTMMANSPGSAPTSSTAPPSYESIQKQLDELRLKSMTVMKVSDSEGSNKQGALLDSGSMHVLRPARDEQERQSCHQVYVTLAGDERRLLDQTASGSIVVEPDKTKDVQSIIPFGKVIECLGCTLKWSKGGFYLHHPKHGRIKTQVKGGCPEITDAGQAAAIIAELEMKKVAELKEKTQELQNQLTAIRMLEQRKADWRVLLAKYSEEGCSADGLQALYTSPVFEALPNEVRTRVAPQLDASPGAGWDYLKLLPLPRRMRKRLFKSSCWVLNMFAGEKKGDPVQTLSGTTSSRHQGEVVVINVDVTLSLGWNLQGEVYKALLWGAMNSKVKAVVASPPISGLASGGMQEGDGDHRFIKDTEMVAKTLFLYLVSYTAAEGAEPAFVIGAPTEATSFWKSDMMKKFQEVVGEIGVKECELEQGGFGHPEIAPMKLLHNVGLDPHHGLKDLRPDHLRPTRDPGFPVRRWCPGLRRAVQEGIRAMGLGDGADGHESEGECELRKLSKEQAWKLHIQRDHVPFRRDCEQCVMMLGTGRPHRRVHQKSCYVLGVDVGGPLRVPSKDAHGSGYKYFLAASYTKPCFADLDPPPEEPLEDLADVEYDFSTLDIEEKEGSGGVADDELSVQCGVFDQDELAEYEPSEVDASEDPAMKKIGGTNGLWDDDDFAAIEQEKDAKANEDEEGNAEVQTDFLYYFKPLKGKSGKHVLKAIQEVVLQLPSQ